ncbi:uncharacterized protein [Physcomitrium patens]|uniref:Uncharacterized protein n=1 Tax=Physcomitrium patens TaxID=3218 RepID=A0A2K1IBY8_PHYPA|nr:hypothetical protein PHYPA_030255 [Physcomitrium patens]
MGSALNVYVIAVSDTTMKLLLLLQRLPHLLPHTWRPGEPVPLWVNSHAPSPFSPFDLFTKSVCQIRTMLETGRGLHAPPATFSSGNRNTVAMEGNAWQCSDGGIVGSVRGRSCAR